MTAPPLRTGVVAPAAPNAVSALTAVATPTAPDRAAQHDGAAPHRFAELLRQSRSERPSPAATVDTTADVPATSEAPCETEEPSQDGTHAAPAQRPATTAKSRMPIAKSATGKAAVESARAHAEPATQEPDPAQDAPPATTSTDERGATLASLAAAAAADGRVDRAPPDVDAGGDFRPRSADGDAATSATSWSADGVPRGAMHARGQAIVDAASSHVARVDASIAVATSSSIEPDFRGALGNAVRAVEGPAGARGNLAGDAAASLAGSSAARSLAEAHALSGVSAIALATPIDAPDFAAALGIQVSLLAQDGVQHAELHLNRAETGPVSIHIAVDGNAARVDFGADHAATRQAIERGLPELASALRDAGLTLTGGGVSQHTGSRHASDERAAPSKGWRDDAGGDAPVATTARVARRISAGGVDLYA